MHILIVPYQEFCPPEKPYQSIFEADQALAIKESGHEVRVLSIGLRYSVFMLLKLFVFKLISLKIHIQEFRKISGLNILSLLYDKIFNPGKFISEDDVRGIHTMRISGLYILPPSKHYNHLSWIRAGKVLMKNYISRFGKPDLIHAHNTINAGILASHIKIKYGIPFIITEHSSFYGRGLYPKKRVFEASKALRHANSTTCVSSFLARGLAPVLKTNVEQWVIIPNILDDIYIKTPLNTYSKKENDCFQFVSVGRYVDVKGFDILINAFAYVFGNNYKVKLKIIGSGELEEELMKMIYRKDISDRISLMGQMSRKQILEELDKSDCFVLSSRYETFGVSLIEALARGLPVISTACGGPGEIVAKADGLLVQPDNIKQLSVAMEWMYNNAFTFDKMEIRNRCIEKYNKNIFSSKIAVIYNKIKNA